MACPESLTAPIAVKLAGTPTFRIAGPVIPVGMVIVSAPTPESVTVIR